MNKTVLLVRVKVYFAVEMNRYVSTRSTYVMELFTVLHGMMTNFTVQ